MPTARDDLAFAIAIDVHPDQVVILREPRIDRVLDPRALVEGVIVQAIAMCLTHYQLIHAILVDICNKDWDTCHAKLKSPRNEPPRLGKRIASRLPESVVNHEATFAIAGQDAETKSMA